MAKDPTHQRLDSIPLPETVRDALSRPSREAPYVSREVRIGEKAESPELTSANHAFYFGKFFPETRGDKVFRVLGWEKAKKGIYTPEVVAGALDYLFRHVKPGEKAQVYVGRSVSELFNGPKDVEDAMTTEGVKPFIVRIAQKKFKKGEADLEVLELEERPENGELFQALRASVDPATGVVDTAKAFGSTQPNLSPGCPSLEIARCLYQAARQSDALINAFLHAVPSRLKGAEEKNPSIAYYALAEVAIRLSDILQGRTIQGGVGRQEEYDGLIYRLMRGEGGSFKNIPDLHPLFGLLKGKRFETLHLDTEKNFYRLNIAKNRARLRLALVGALGLSAITGAVEYGRHAERKERQQIEAKLDKRIAEELKDTTFYFEHKFALEKRMNVPIFRRVLKSMAKELELRYQVPSEFTGELELLLAQYLIDHKGELNNLEEYPYFVQDAVDLFVRGNPVYFEQKGVSVEKPNAHLRGYLPMIKAAAEDESEWGMEMPQPGDIRYVSPPMGYGMEKIEFEPLGTFTDGRGWEYTFFLTTDKKGKSRLVGKLWAEIGFRHGEGVSAKDTRETAKVFLESLRRWDAVPLKKFQDLMWCYKSGGEWRGVPPSVERPADDGIWTIRPRTVYRDSLGGFEYEVVVDSVYDSKTKSSQDVLLARRYGESHFSTEGAKEVAIRYFYATEPWNKDWEAKAKSLGK